MGAIECRPPPRPVHRGRENAARRASRSGTRSYKQRMFEDLADAPGRGVSTLPKDFRRRDQMRERCAQTSPISFSTLARAPRARRQGRSSHKRARATARLGSRELRRPAPGLRRRGATGATSPSRSSTDWQAARRRTEPEPSAQRRGDTGLNPKYTFEQFVIWDGNRLAHAAALAVAELPGHAYNPLFLYGPPGLGKTHLLHAIGNYVADYGGGSTVRYTTVETFTNEFVAAIRRRSGAFQGALPLRRRAADRRHPVPPEKARTEEEFFHTFNALYEGGPSSSSPPIACPATWRPSRTACASASSAAW